MHRKNNPLITAPFEAKEGIFAPFCEKRIRIGDNLSFVQRKHKNKNVMLPMYLHSFRFIAPKKVSEAQKFALKFPSADKIETVADKLRYYRHQKGLYQSDVADYLSEDVTATYYLKLYSFFNFSHISYATGHTLTLSINPSKCHKRSG